MAVGCTFICNNDQCEHCGKSIELTGPWPMANMDDILDVLEEENSQYLSEFQSLKEHGREYACLTLPDTNNLLIEAFRIQKWCQKCHLISVFEVHPDEVQDVSNREDVCMKCETETLMSFTNAIDVGIQCPFCHSNMVQKRWYANERL